LSEGSGKLYVKTYQTAYGKLVAACDRELLGAELRDEGAVLILSEEFYGGELVTESEAAEILATASMATLVGERAVAVALRCGLVHPSAVAFVRGVPFAMFVRT